MCLFNFPNKSSIKAYNKGIVEFECGSCPECLQKKSRLWALRCAMEAKDNIGCMVTLTYDTYKVVYGKETKEENPTDPSISLSKRDCQLFIKRLRKYFTNNRFPIKYLLTAERGKRTGRAHYHALLFGIQFDDLIKYKKSDRGNWIYKSRTLEKIWQKGICTVDCINLNAKTARYCTKYCSKDTGIDDTFMLFSRGIGDKRLLEDFDGKSYWIDGREYSIPKQIWHMVIEARYNCLGLSKYTPKVRLEDTEKKILNEMKRTEKRIQCNERRLGIVYRILDNHHKKRRNFRKESTRLSWERRLSELDMKCSSYKIDRNHILLDSRSRVQFYLSMLRRSDEFHQFGLENNQRYQELRDNDPQYLAYIRYWSDKAKSYEKTRPTVDERILALPNDKYRSYKTKCILAKHKQQKGYDFVPPRSKIQSFVKFSKRKIFEDRSFAPLTRHYRANDTLKERYKDEIKELRSLRSKFLLKNAGRIDTILEKEVYLWSFEKNRLIFA